MTTSLTYAVAGVDIDAGERFAQMIKERVAAAWPSAGKEIGGFAGACRIPGRVKTLKAGTDGTGTKAILAALVEDFSGIGQDAVAMAAVDTYVSGVQPAAILDVLDVAKLDPDKHIGIIDSIIAACQLAGCQLIGGETAELPDMFKHGWMFNLNVTCIGFSPPDERAHTLFPEARVRPGQRIYGWPSLGPASNGFSMLRKVFRLKQDGPTKIRQRLERHHPELGQTLAQALLQPTPIWIRQIEKAKEAGIVFSAHAHITGGGLPGNIPRILPNDCKVVLDRSLWERPPIFPLAQRLGNIDTSEMDRTFNQGIMVISIVSKGSLTLNDDPVAIHIGQVESRHGDEPQVQFTGRHAGE